jgi:type II secretory pathway pseudopilin PulG
MNERSITQERWSLVVGTAVFGIVVAMIAMSLMRQRDAASARTCNDRMMNLLEAAYTYHDVYKLLPPAVTGTDGDDPDRCNQSRLSGFAALLPFVDQQPAWSALADPRRNPDTSFPSMGPSPSFSPAEFELWGMQFSVFMCPAEKTSRVDYGMRSYVFCYGDTVRGVGRRIMPGELQNNRAAAQWARASQRGMFAPSGVTRLQDCRDGLSSTIMMSEVASNPQRGWLHGSVARVPVSSNEDRLEMNPSLGLAVISSDDNKRFANGTRFWSLGRGSRWAEGTMICNAFTTVYPPNGPSVTAGDDYTTGIMPPSSHHAGGVHVGFGDGSIEFITNTIDTGDLKQPPKGTDMKTDQIQSPYGLWGAMGTRAAGEVIPNK